MVKTQTKTQAWLQIFKIIYFRVYKNFSNFDLTLEFLFVLR